MAARNYYVVLGVASNETDQGVRAAFRDLAKRYHPDRVGPSGAGPFREVAEAYEVLGDPARRRQYDASLERSPHALPVRRLVREVSMRRDLVDVRPSEEAMFRAGLRVGVPVFGRCARCGGRGCIGCDGSGTVEGERPVAVDLPPMSGKGTTFVLPLAGLGIHNFYLRVRVRVDKATEPQSTEAKEG